jgi:hypothetical protein
MKGRRDRSTIEIRERYGGVFKQQGRVQVDADWNEEAEIDRPPGRIALRDIIGRCGAPRDAAGFAISLERNSLLIGAGRYYVEGLLVGNETDLVPYERQPDFPDPPSWTDALAQAGGSSGLAYLDVWVRDVTHLDDQSLLDVALGGPDTTPRVSNVWQVRVLPLVGPQEPGLAERASCRTVFPEWDAIVANPEGRMNARVQATTDPDASSGLATPGGYRGLENRLYRVEVRRGGPGAGQGATFKWSRDNGGADGLEIGSDWVALEDGIEVQFSQGTYRTGDYWLIPARTATRDIEWPQGTTGTPESQLPSGIQHYYCRLAIIARDADGEEWKVVEDCRPIFSPLVGGGTGDRPRHQRPRRGQ